MEKLVIYKVSYYDNQQKTYEEVYCKNFESMVKTLENLENKGINKYSINKMEVL